MFWENSFFRVKLKYLRIRCICLKFTSRLMEIPHALWNFIIVSKDNSKVYVIRAAEGGREADVCTNQRRRLFLITMLIYYFSSRKILLANAILNFISILLQPSFVLLLPSLFYHEFKNLKFLWARPKQHSNFTEWIQYEISSNTVSIYNCHFDDN